jgi:hypothetical protein
MLGAPKYTVNSRLGRDARLLPGDTVPATGGCAAHCVDLAPEVELPPCAGGGPRSEEMERRRRSPCLPPFSSPSLHSRGVPCGRLLTFSPSSLQRASTTGRWAPASSAPSSAVRVGGLASATVAGRPSPLDPPPWPRPRWSLGSPPRAGDAPNLVLPRAALELGRHRAAPLRASSSTASCRLWEKEKQRRNRGEMWEKEKRKGDKNPMTEGPH